MPSPVRYSEVKAMLERNGWQHTRTASSLMTTSGTLTFSPFRDGTLMAWDWQVRPKGWLRALGPVFGPIGNRVERGIWTGLKHHLEQSPPNSAA